MTLEYEQKTETFSAVATILDDYIQWYMQVSTAVAYPNDASVEDDLSSPNSFLDWVNASMEKGSLLADVLDNLVGLYTDLLASSEILIQTVSDHKKPDYQDYLDFKNLFDAFTGRLRRLERDSAAEGAGMDEKTGLRSQKVMEDDLKKEIERVARQGSPFSLVLTRIDNYLSFEDKDSVIELTVDNIKKCMRTFDDAYYMDDGVFLLSLKQADMIGAQAATTRLQNFIKTDEKNRDEVTLSYCMSEPVSGDEIDELVNNMKADLESYDDEEDVVLKFIESSPLQRYIDEING
ncbi:MAG: hypothetical protein CMH31_02615 [Micavibrio sp.]|nr:hypothetical protein [Micavibrio sp.]|tara:strand:+ start:459 stop:1334 length:876 start_codon:yes stop_codon:yes gene_type:complete